LTLYIVYKDRNFLDKSEWLSFFKKRVLRILPLFSLITILTFFISRNFSYFSLKTLFLNVTGLFSIFSSDKYIVTGGWSVGNELFFYLLFPILMLFTKRISWIVACLLLSWGIAIYFAFFVLKNFSALGGDSWKIYINHFNQLFLFVSGIGIGKFLTSKQTDIILLLIFTLLIIIFIIFPVSGDIIQIASGSNRIIFSILSVLICASIYKLSISLPRFIFLPLLILGEISYGIYLIHPIIFKIVFKGVGRYFYNETILFSISILLTLLVSYISYITIERYFINLGKR
ncbi:acyltransferase family protein, partial [Rodentibacter pneumotropicus]